jgi:hypothetical protein
MSDATPDAGYARIVIEPLRAACPQGDASPSQMRPALDKDIATSLEVATFYWENRSPNVMAPGIMSIMGYLGSGTCTVLRAYGADGRPMTDGQSTNIVACAVCREYTLPVSKRRRGDVSCASISNSVACACA